MPQRIERPYTSRWTFAFLSMTGDVNGRDGITRYGRLLARNCNDPDALRGNLIPVGSLDSIRPDSPDIIQVLVIQFSPNHNALEILDDIFKRMTSWPNRIRIVIILHDANHLPEPRDGFLYYRHFMRPRSLFKAWKGSEVQRKLVKIVKNFHPRVCLCVFSDLQRRRMPSSIRDEVFCVPHFVESVEKRLEKRVAKAEIGLEGRKIITILGWIDPRKNAELAIRSLQIMPSEYILVLAGAPLGGNTMYVNQLIELAKELDVSEQLKVTGYLEDEKQVAYIAATDLALCIFKTASASGTISTWIAHNIPILAEENREFDIYGGIEGVLIQSRMTSPEKLARAVMGIVSSQASDPSRPARELRESLSIARTWSRIRGNVEIFTGGEV